MNRWLKGGGPPYCQLGTIMKKTNESVCSYHVTYAFHSESTLYGFVNVKEILARSRIEIWSLSGCNLTRTHNHLADKWTLNHFFFLNGWVLVYELSDCGFKSSCNHLNQIRFANKRRTNTWKVMLFKRSFLCPIYNLVR